MHQDKTRNQLKECILA